MMSDTFIGFRKKRQCNLWSPMDVSAVMPCLNEERTIAACVQKAQASIAALGMQGEVVVVDNGSTDRSAEIARALGARVVSERRKGYGAALRTGIEASRG